MGREQPTDILARAFQRYVDRGVFRGFSARRGRGARQEFEFSWLTRRPMTLSFQPESSMLTFRRLFPVVEPTSTMAAELKALVDARHTRDLPAHKRLDARRAKATCSIRGGDFSLAVTVRGQHHEYALKKALNLVNELSLVVQEKYPDYLIEQFGFSPE